MTKVTDKWHTKFLAHDSCKDREERREQTELGSGQLDAVEV